MNKKLVKEIKQIMSIYKLQNYHIDDFPKYADWYHIAYNVPLSENFIQEFQNKVNWEYISQRQKLSEKFIRNFHHRVYWWYISSFQTLSEDFISEFKDKVDWLQISKQQTLSEDFIRKFKNKVRWDYISRYQKLSEDFIREFKDYVDWYDISACQTLSLKFRKEFKYKIYMIHYNDVHKEKAWNEKRQEMRKYAKKYNLKFDGKYLYAFREHDKWGRGAHIHSIFYKTGKYYRDWHCDMRSDEPNSFGLGIWPKGNTPVKVDVKDWGLWLKNDDSNGKCRVWGFTVI